MELLKEYLPLLLPVILIQLALLVAALVHILTHRKYRFGNRIIWIVIAVFIGYLGPIAYFTIGKGEE